MYDLSRFVILTCMSKAKRLHGITDESRKGSQPPPPHPFSPSIAHIPLIFNCQKPYTPHPTPTPTRTHIEQGVRQFWLLA
jgi:hypothetical protein